MARGGYRGSQGDSSIKDNIVFAAKKVKALYPLHCFTFIVAMVVYWDYQRLDSARHILIWVFKVLVNLLLLQSCFPKAEFYFSFNAVSWYLSTTAVLYFTFPYIWRKISSIKNKYEVLFQFIIIIAIQSTISALLLIYSEQVSHVPITISDDLTKYVTYICPLYRMGDFYIGCLLGCVFWHSNSDIEKSKVITSIIEILSFVTIGFLQLIYNRQIGFLGTNAFRYALLYIFNVMLLIYIVGCQRGILSKYVLSSKLMVLIGNLSGYAFLIHQLVIVIMRRIFESLGPITLLSFIVTIIFAYLLMSLRAKILGIKCLRTRY